MNQAFSETERKPHTFISDFSLSDGAPPHSLCQIKRETDERWPFFTPAMNEEFPCTTFSPQV